MFTHEYNVVVSETCICSIVNNNVSTNIQKKKDT